jgi:uncharacterized damage-inducible protein DinB
MTDDAFSTVLAELRSLFRAQRDLAERAIAQLEEQELFRTGGEGQNSVAILMKHVGGNLRSRWTDPLSTDGEKPDRNRDREFEVETSDSGAAVRAVWDEGWRVLEEALAGFTATDLSRTITIRQQPLTLLQALQRSLVHTAQHAGQVVLLARQWRGERWQTLSIPRGESAAYLRRPPP